MHAPMHGKPPPARLRAVPSQRRAAAAARAAGELALSRGQLDLASDCLAKAQDVSGLLLLAAAKVCGRGGRGLARGSVLRMHGAPSFAWLA